MEDLLIEVFFVINKNMNVFEVCLTNYCNFKCSYCISDKTRGFDKFSESLKLDELGNLLLHDKELSQSELEKRELILSTQGQSALDEYVASEHSKWESTRHLKHDFTDWMDFDALIAFIRNKLDSTWIITLTGGEPLYYPNVEDLICELTKTNKVVVTSNISLVRSKPKLLTISRDMLFFRVGYHPEFRNLSTFIDCMDYLISNNFKYLINYVLHPSYYIESEVYVEHLALLDQHQYNYEVTPFEGSYKEINYPKSRFNRNEIERKLLNLNSQYEPTMSAMGSNFMICEPDGKIYECQGKHKNLGSVYDQELKLAKVSHTLCFMSKGCPTLKSANKYISEFEGTHMNFI